MICMTTYRWQQVLCSRAYSPLFEMEYIWSAVHELLFIDTKFSSKILSSIFDDVTTQDLLKCTRIKILHRMQLFRLKVRMRK